MRSQTPRARLRRAAAAPLAPLLALALAATGCGGSSYRPLTGSRLVRQSTGLLADRPFNQPTPTTALQNDFEFNGSAPLANRFASASADGLHVGVRQHAPGTFEGYFAVTRASYPATSVFHAHVYRQPGIVTRRDQSGEAVFAVQTGTTKKTGDINYVLVASSTTNGATHWLVGFAQGRVADASTTVLWTGPSSPHGDLGEDITLRSDGRSSLEVHFGPRLVYASRRLNMNIVPPFQPYLEVQGLGIRYESRFQEFWVVSDDVLTVKGLAPGDQVTLAPAHAAPISVAASSDGEARLKLPLNDVRGSGTLTVRRKQQTLASPVTYAGGDVYSVSA